MQLAQIWKLRRRKLQQYAALLPPDAVSPALFAFTSDADYAVALLEIVRVAPPGFGITVGLHRRLSDLGILGLVTKTCATLREVLELWMVYAESAGELARFDIDFKERTNDNNLSIVIRPYPVLPPAVRDLIVDELCTSFFVFVRELTGLNLVEFAVELGHPALPGVDYRAGIPGRLGFDSSVTRLSGPAATLEHRLLPHDDAPAERLMVRLDGRRTDLEPDRSTTLLLYDFFIRRRAGAPCLGDAAAALRVSERTLIRRLAVEGTSYGDVLEEFRRHYALTLARYGGLRAKQIAHLVGFKSENSLRRAFKKWTGQPIGAWVPPPEPQATASGSAPS